MTTLPDDRIARGRRVVLALAGALTLFWLYTFYYIGRHANPMGDGMEWIAVMPMSFIFLALTMPSLILGAFTRAVRLAAVFALGALLLNTFVWLQLLGEFAPHTR